MFVDIIPDNNSTMAILDNTKVLKHVIISSARVTNQTTILYLLYIDCAEYIPINSMEIIGNRVPSSASIIATTS